MPLAVPVARMAARGSGIIRSASLSRKCQTVAVEPRQVEAEGLELVALNHLMTAQEWDLKSCKSHKAKQDQ